MFRKLIHTSRFTDIIDRLSRLGREWLPYSCLLCGQTTRSPLMLCLSCADGLPILPDSCEICAQNLPPAAKGRICGACLRDKPFYDKARPLFPYEWPISTLIIRLKFRHELPIANLFGKLISERIIHAWYGRANLPDLIVPVPLHPKRLAERGFNQAQEIAKIIGKNLIIPLDLRGTARIKETETQSLLKASKRKQNMMDAFAVYRRYTGLSLAVVDDVMTTGHTVNTFSQALRSQGAKKIDIWCIARKN